MRLALTILILTACDAGQVPSHDAGVGDAPTDIPSVSTESTRPPVLLPLAQAPACPADNPPPCVVEVVSFAEPAQIGYRLCCPGGVVAIAALAVDSTAGPWGDVTKWAWCGWGYVEEVTHPRRGGTLPWAVLNTYDGNGGDISECRSSGAPPGLARGRGGKCHRFPVNSEPQRGQVE
jgi:hypothetical protein